jgi:hypothetical protein
MITEFKHTPITDNDTNYFALSLIDRGMADTRALAITKGLEENNWDRVVSAILNCDGFNFPRLLRIEPRLIHLALEKTNDGALRERLEQYRTT